VRYGLVVAALGVLAIPVVWGILATRERTIMVLIMFACEALKFDLRRHEVRGSS
jgi:hypothetical protein